MALATRARRGDGRREGGGREAAGVGAAGIPGGGAGAAGGAPPAAAAAAAAPAKKQAHQGGKKPKGKNRKGQKYVPKTPLGMRDYHPQEMAVREAVFDTIVGLSLIHI